jgi:hypothetical protein
MRDTTGVDLLGLGVRTVTLLTKQTSAFQLLNELPLGIMDLDPNSG